MFTRRDAACQGEAVRDTAENHHIEDRDDAAARWLPARFARSAAYSAGLAHYLPNSERGHNDSLPGDDWNETGDKMRTNNRVRVKTLLNRTPNGNLSPLHKEPFNHTYYGFQTP